MHVIKKYQIENNVDAMKAIELLSGVIFKKIRST